MRVLTSCGTASSRPYSAAPRWWLDILPAVATRCRQPRSRRSRSERRARGLTPLPESGRRFDCLAHAARSGLFPVAVERALHLHGPDDRRNQEDPEGEQPEPGPAGHGLRLTVTAVHLPELRRDDEGGHR